MLKQLRKFKFTILAVLIIALSFVIMMIINFNINETSQEPEGQSENNVEPVNLVQHFENSERNNQFYFPDNFDTEYISFKNFKLLVFKTSEYPRLESWPEDGEIKCEESLPGSEPSLKITKREINGKKYCIASYSEGAAGSVITQYSYSTVIGENIYIANFITRYPSCLNYPDEELEKCAEERKNFDLDISVDKEIHEELENLEL